MRGAARSAPETVAACVPSRAFPPSTSGCRCHIFRVAWRGVQQHTRKMLVTNDDRPPLPFFSQARAGRSAAVEHPRRWTRRLNASRCEERPFAHDVPSLSFLQASYQYFLWSICEFKDSTIMIQVWTLVLNCHLCRSVQHRFQCQG